MTPAKVPLSIVLDTTVGAVAQGVSREELFRRSLIDVRFGDDRDEISNLQFILLCLNLSTVLGDCLHGMGERPMRTEYCELALHAMLGSPTLLEGLSAFQTAFFLGSSSLRIDLRSEGDVAILSIIAAPGTGRNGRMLESVNADWLFMCASFFMGRVLPVTEIVTRDLRFARSSYVRSCTGARVRIGKATSLRFPKSCLAVRRVALPSASPMMDCIRFMHLKVGHFVAQSQADDPDLNGRTLRLESLAHREGVSVSTLRRRMEESHGGFRAFRQRELVNAAVDMLRASDATVDSIALDLGYADARSFRRFLKAALGKTPQEVRYTQDDDLAPYVSDGDVYRRITHIIAGIGDGVGAVT